jgi:hypothetical protein
VQWDPIFISDALVADVDAHIAWLDAHGGVAVAARLRAAAASGAMLVREVCTRVARARARDGSSILRRKFELAWVVCVLT